MNITQHTTTFYTPATKRLPPLGITLHNTVTQTLVAPSANGSWHYEIGRAGDVHQYVHDMDYAWHVRATDEWRPPWMVQRDSRVSEANSCTCGIELVSYAGNTAGVAVPVAYTDSQYAALKELLALLYERYGAIPIVTHGSMQLDRTDPVRLDFDRAGLVWRGDGYRFEEGEDMARIQELQGQLDQANGINTELQRQVSALREEVATRTQERDALQGVANTYAPRIATMEEALRIAVAAASRRPQRVEVQFADGHPIVFVPEAA